MRRWTTRRYLLSVACVIISTCFFLAIRQKHSYIQYGFKPTHEPHYLQENVRTSKFIFPNMLLKTSTMAQSTAALQVYYKKNDSKISFKTYLNEDSKSYNLSLNKQKETYLNNQEQNSLESTQLKNMKEDINNINANETDEGNTFDITDIDQHVTLRPSAKQTYDEQIKALHDVNGHGEEIPWYNLSFHSSLEYRMEVFKANYRPIKNQANFDCYGLASNDPDIMEQAQRVMREVPRKAVSVRKYARTSDCNNFKRGRGYINHPLSPQEFNFPLAFGIIVYKDVEQAERLLRAIYRPHNYYCFHVDIKSAPIDRLAFETIANCFENVFLTKKSLNVTWGNFSVLQAELLCMETLWPYKKWKYYINLTGQEFPLKTNKEIVAILQAMDGANIVDGTWIRARHKYFYRWTQAKRPPPHKIRPIKGAVHVAVNRHFVDFCLHDNRSLDFLDWLKDTLIPDETFFASLNHNPQLKINGSFLGEAEEYPLKPSLMRYKNWQLGHSVFVRNCAGKYVRHICVLGVGDLHRALDDIGLFANKFTLDFEYLALDCLEELLHQKTWKLYVNDEEIDTTYYKHLDFVKKKLTILGK